MVFGFIYALFIIAYYVIIGYFTFSYVVLYMLEAFNIYMYEFGKAPVMAAFVILTLAALLLPLLVLGLKRRYRFLILIVFLALYYFAPIAANNFIHNKYGSFSYEEWNENTEVRQIMYLSLLDEDEGILGKTPQEVSEIVGTPDYEENEDENDNIIIYGYITSPGTVRVYFEDDAASYIEYSSSW